jgi:hypothetical protein
MALALIIRTDPFGPILLTATSVEENLIWSILFKKTHKRMVRGDDLKSRLNIFALGYKSTRCSSRSSGLLQVTIP